MSRRRVTKDSTWTHPHARVTAPLWVWRTVTLVLGEGMPGPPRLVRYVVGMVLEAGLPTSERYWAARTPNHATARFADFAALDPSETQTISGNPPETPA